MCLAHLIYSQGGWGAQGKALIKNRANLKSTMDEIIVTIRVGDNDVTRTYSGDVDRTDVEQWGERVVDMLDVLTVGDDQAPLL